MIKVITDNQVTIEAATVELLLPKLNEIFKADAVAGVTLTYVLTKQPTSRRMTPTSN